MAHLLRRLVRQLKVVGRYRHPRFVYSSRYAVEVPWMKQDPRRAENILTFLAMNDLIARGDLSWPRPASFAALARVHDQTYLASLLEPGGLVPMLGVELPAPLEERVWLSQRMMVGGTMRAARLALEGRRRSINLGGGLHHAHADRGHGFCLINDVAVAIAELRSQGFGERILVIDLDLHDGDGTRTIFAADDSVHTFSIHNQDLAPVEAVGDTSIALGAGVEDAAYLAALREHLPRALAAAKPGLVFYLAGVDPAADDGIGNWRITAAGLLARDRFVVEQVERPGRPRLPLVVLLAGGYGTGAWRYSARFLGWYCSGGERLEPPSTEGVILRRYRYFASLMQPEALTGPARGNENELGISAEDLLPGGTPMPASRLLDFYSPEGIEHALERYGFFARLRSRGFDHPVLECELDNPAGQTIRVFADEERQDVLVELRLRRDRRMLPDGELLVVEWLLLQNPRARFPAGRRPLPGQKHPGLSLLRDVVALLVLICDRLRLDGVLFVPAHYHIARQSYPFAHFLEPADEGRFLALEALLAGLPFPEAAELVARGKVFDASAGTPFEWKPVPMVIPVSPRLRDRIQGDEHRRLADEARAVQRLEILPAS
ncbi:MAG TPA: histone deacetylase [Thermoanaerobaculia bacterium]|nr:histone deacetylase [Thermoanaerobaculia bacterium]